MKKTLFLLIILFAIFAGVWDLLKINERLENYLKQRRQATAQLEIYFHHKYCGKTTFDVKCN